MEVLGNTGEAFYTGGGAHVFANFEKSENYQNLTVAAGFQNSVNLVFIRLMRDMVNYYRYRVPGATPGVLEDWDNPARQNIWPDSRTRKANSTSRVSKPSIAQDVHLTPLRAAVIYRSIRPKAGLDQFTAFMKKHFPSGVLTGKNDPAELFEKYGMDRSNVAEIAARSDQLRRDSHAHRAGRLSGDL